LSTSFNPVFNAMQREKRSVALHSLYAALIITALKLWVGFSTDSLGILSEAAHSGLDTLAAFITFLSVRISDVPADADHQYGHGKVENFSAFIEMGLLLLTCIWIVWEALHRLMMHNTHIVPTFAAFAVMFFSLCTDIWRSRLLKRTAVKYESQALEADALHFSTDIYSSAVVIFGLALVWVGSYYNIGWLENADPIAALVVAGVVLFISSRLARQTIDVLLDAAPVGVRAEIITRIERIDGVTDIDRVRIRQAGNKHFADVSFGMSRIASFQRSEQVGADVTAAVRAVLPDADVVIHSIPRAMVNETVFDRVRGAASRHNLFVHDVNVQDLRGKIHVEMHLELDEGMTLRAAHDRVTFLEAEIKKDVPEVDSILTHIESEPATIESGGEIVTDPAIERSLRELAGEFPEIIDIHDVVVKQVRGLSYLSCHCTMNDDLPLSRVHDISTALEIRLRHAAPKLFKVLIHTEPMTDNKR